MLNLNGIQALIVLNLSFGESCFLFMLMCGLKLTFLVFEILLPLHSKLLFRLLHITVFLPLVGLEPLPDGLIVTSEACDNLISFF